MFLLVLCGVYNVILRVYLGALKTSHCEVFLTGCSNPAVSAQKTRHAEACRFLAETVGFEPTVPEGTTDFESVPL